MTIEEVLARSDELKAAIAEANAVPVDQLTTPELIDRMREWDRLGCEAHDCQLRLIGHLRRSAPPVALGGTPLATTLSKRLRISEEEARECIDEAVALGYG